MRDRVLVALLLIWVVVCLVVAALNVVFFAKQPAAGMEPLVKPGNAPMAAEVGEDSPQSSPGRIDLSREAPRRTPSRVGGESSAPAAGTSSEEWVDPYWAEEFLPTPFGLWCRTTSMWSQPSFAHLTREEAVKLLPVVEDELGTFPQYVWEIFGGFPTIDDCRIGLALPGAQELMDEWVRAEDLLTTLRMTPKAERDEAFQEKEKALVERTNEAQDQLMEILDRGTTWRGWRALARLEREWR